MLNGRRNLLGISGLFFSFTLTMAQTFKNDGAVVSVTLRNGAAANVPFPEAQPWQDSVQEWTLGSVKFSPDSTFAVVLFNWSVPKYWDATAYLVKQNGTFEKLKNSAVWRAWWIASAKRGSGMAE